MGCTLDRAKLAAGFLGSPYLMYPRPHWGPVRVNICTPRSATLSQFRTRGDDPCSLEAYLCLPPRVPFDPRQLLSCPVGLSLLPLLSMTRGHLSVLPSRVPFVSLTAFRSREF